MIILGILLIILIIFGIERIDDKNDKATGITMILISIFMFAFIVFYEPNKHKDRNEPQAIDVYRDKTELHVTYKDTIALDSTVVWKIERKTVMEIVK